MALRSSQYVSLQGFLARDPSSYQDFPFLIYPQLRRMAEQLAPDIPTDLQEDIVNETWVKLLEKSPTHYDVHRGSERPYIGLVMRDAVKRVRANYRPPGSLSRQRRQQELQSAISFEDQIERGVQFVNDQQASVEDRCLATEILTHMDKPTAEALLRVYVRGERVQEVAAVQGRNRFQVSRDMKAAIQYWKEAA